MPPTSTVQSVEWGSVAQWAAATATFLAVLVALFKDDFYRFWRRPKLGASIKLMPPDCQKTQVNYQTFVPTLLSHRADCYYLRLWIENKGKIRAEKVQAFAAQLLRKSADGTFAAVEAFLPMNLRWAHGWAGPNGVEIYADGISPQMGKHCDLGHIVDPQHRAGVCEDLPSVPSGKCILAFDVEARTSTPHYLVAPGIYQLELRIAAANCRPTTCKFEITLAGDWFTDQKRMFTEGLGIRAI